MKKIYLIIGLLFILSLANAAPIIITVQVASFNPANTTAQCGDTIVWVWGNSGTHTTTSTTIPVCATSWNAPISATSFTFAITVPCAGTYNYQCTPHLFTGTITVTCPNGISVASNDYFSSSLVTIVS